MRSLAGCARVLAPLVSLFSAISLAELASAAEPDESGAAENRQTPSQPVSTETICSALAAAAAQNDLPTDFFARLIWQESRFNPAAVSRAGAQGVAQFMPATANWRGLSNPFDPLEAIVHSAKLLRDLRREFWKSRGSQRPPTMPAPGECATGSPAGEPSRERQARMCAS